MDKIGELQKLKQLLDDGLITKVEYDSLKAEIIGSKPQEEPKKEEPVVPPATPVEPKHVVAEEPIVEAKIAPTPEVKTSSEPSPKKNQKVLLGVLIGVGVVVVGILVKIVFFPPAVVDDSLTDEPITDETIVVPDVDESPLKTTVSASSSIPASSGLDYFPANAIDGNLNTWWTPKRNPKGEEWLKIQFDRSAYINTINIHGGSHHPNYSYKDKDFGDLYYMNLRVRKARLEFSDGSFQFITLRDEDFIQEIVLDESVSTTFVKIIPLTAYQQVGGWDDYCISEVSFKF